MDSMYEEFECPICTEYLFSPIYQCISGHSFCWKCYPQLEICPLCKASMSETRNYILENLSTNLFTTCVNEPLGCTAILPKTKTEEHELICEFGKVFCQYPGCDWFGKITELLNHWESKELEEEIYEMSHDCEISIPKEVLTPFVNLFKAHDRLFWFKYQTDDEGFMEWALQLIGEESEEFEYFYKIEIMNTTDGEKNKKIVLSDYCLEGDLDEEEEDIFKGAEGASIPISVLSKFLVEDKLSFKVEIKHVRIIQEEVEEEQECLGEDLQENQGRAQSPNLPVNQGRAQSPNVPVNQGRAEGRNLQINQGRAKRQNLQENQSQHLQVNQGQNVVSVQPNFGIPNPMSLGYLPVFNMHFHGVHSHNRQGYRGRCIQNLNRGRQLRFQVVKNQGEQSSSVEGQNKLPSRGRNYRTKVQRTMHQHQNAQQHQQNNPEGQQNKFHRPGNQKSMGGQNRQQNQGQNRPNTSQNNQNWQNQVQNKSYNQNQAQNWPNQVQNKSHNQNQGQSRPNQGQNKNQNQNQGQNMPYQGQNKNHNQNQGQSRPNQGQNKNHNQNQGQNMPNQGQNKSHNQNQGQSRPNQGQNKNHNQNMPNHAQNKNQNQGQSRSNQGQNTQNQGQNRQYQGQNKSHGQNQGQNKPNQAQNKSHNQNQGQNRPNQGQNKSHSGKSSKNN